MGQSDVKIITTQYYIKRSNFKNVLHLSFLANIHKTENMSDAFMAGPSKNVVLSFLATDPQMSDKLKIL